MSASLQQRPLLHPQARSAPHQMHCQLASTASIAVLPEVVVAATRSGRRGPRNRQVEAPAGDGVLWPLLLEQQRLRAHIPGAEQLAAEVRAQLLVEKGWGSLEAWLNHKGQHPSEGVARPAGVGGLADLFDDEAA